ncbi:hypothetical protein KC325_g183 [Hortaea werneckii]|nr:hypothetical protein KC325_g183 [Hortaea werneckii]
MRLKRLNRSPCILDSAACVALQSGQSSKTHANSATHSPRSISSLNIGKVVWGAVELFIACQRIGWCGRSGRFQDIPDGIHPCSDTDLSWKTELVRTRHLRCGSRTSHDVRCDVIIHEIKQHLHGQEWMLLESQESTLPALASETIAVKRPNILTNSDL